MAVQSVKDLALVVKDSTELASTLNEIDIFEKQYDELVSLYDEVFTVSSKSDQDKSDQDHESNHKDGSKSDSALGRDMWKQLQREKIPVFTGDKTKYPVWKAAFQACIDESPSTPQYKLLQLRQYLGGEALHSIENLGHSKEAYNAAKEGLDRKYGGTKRVVNQFLDELENFQPLRNETPQRTWKIC